MKRGWKRILSTVISQGLWIVLLCSRTIAQDPTLTSIIKESLTYTENESYCQPNQAELDSFQTLFIDLLLAHETQNEAKITSLNQRAQTLGFRIDRYKNTLADMPSGVTVLRELQGVRKGGGDLLPGKSSTGFTSPTTYHYTVPPRPFR